MLSIAEHNDLTGSRASTDRRTAQARIASLWPGGLLALAFAIAVAIPLFWPVALGPLVGFALIMLCFVSGGFTAMLVERRFDGVARQVVADTNRMAIRIMLPCLLLIGAAGRLDIVSNGVSGSGTQLDAGLDLFPASADRADAARCVRASGQRGLITGERPTVTRRAPSPMRSLQRRRSRSCRWQESARP